MLTEISAARENRCAHELLGEFFSVVESGDIYVKLVCDAGKLFKLEVITDIDRQCNEAQIEFRQLRQKIRTVQSATAQRHDGVITVTQLLYIREGADLSGVHAVRSHDSNPIGRVGGRHGRKPPLLTKCSSSGRSVQETCERSRRRRWKARILPLGQANTVRRPGHHGFVDW